jgi:hypothetical protein
MDFLVFYFSLINDPRAKILISSLGTTKGIILVLFLMGLTDLILYLFYLATEYAVFGFIILDSK